MKKNYTGIILATVGITIKIIFIILNIYLYFTSRFSDNLLILFADIATIIGYVLLIVGSFTDNKSVRTSGVITYLVALAIGLFDIVINNFMSSYLIVRSFEYIIDNAFFVILLVLQLFTKGNKKALSIVNIIDFAILILFIFWGVICGGIFKIGYFYSFDNLYVGGMLAVLIRLFTVLSTILIYVGIFLDNHFEFTKKVLDEKKVSHQKPVVKNEPQSLYGYTRITEKKTESVADEIKKFKELLDMGAITEEEYNKKKKELLK